MHFNAFVEKFKDEFPLAVNMLTYESFSLEENRHYVCDFSQKMALNVRFEGEELLIAVDVGLALSLVDMMMLGEGDITKFDRELIETWCDIVSSVVGISTDNSSYITNIPEIKNIAKFIIKQKDIEAEVWVIQTQEASETVSLDQWCDYYEANYLDDFQGVFGEKSEEVSQVHEGNPNKKRRDLSDLMLDEASSDENDEATIYSQETIDALLEGVEDTEVSDVDINEDEVEESPYLHSSQEGNATVWETKVEIFKEVFISTFRRPPPYFADTSEPKPAVTLSKTKERYEDKKLHFVYSEIDGISYVLGVEAVALLENHFNPDDNGFSDIQFGNIDMEVEGWVYEKVILFFKEFTELIGAKTYSEPQYLLNVDAMADNVLCHLENDIANSFVCFGQLSTQAQSVHWSEIYEQITGRQYLFSVDRVKERENRRVFVEGGCEILSQVEIDALLDVADEEEDSAFENLYAKNGIETVDLDDHQISVIKTIHQPLVDYISSHIDNIDVNMEVKDSDYLGAATKGGFLIGSLGTIQLSHYHFVNLGLPWQLLYALSGHYLGVPHFGDYGKHREIDIYQKSLLEDFSLPLKEGWGDLVSDKLEVYASDEVIKDDSKIVLVTLHCQIGDFKSELRIAYMSAFVEAVIPKQIMTKPAQIQREIKEIESELQNFCDIQVTRHLLYQPDAIVKALLKTFSSNYAQILQSHMGSILIERLDQLDIEVEKMPKAMKVSLLENLLTVVKTELLLDPNLRPLYEFVEQRDQHFLEELLYYINTASDYGILSLVSDLSESNFLYDLLMMAVDGTDIDEIKIKADALYSELEVFMKKYQEELDYTLELMEHMKRCMQTAEKAIELIYAGTVAEEAEAILKESISYE